MDLYRRDDRLLFLSFYKVLFFGPPLEGEKKFFSIFFLFFFCHWCKEGGEKE